MPKTAEFRKGRGAFLTVKSTNYVPTLQTLRTVWEYLGLEQKKGQKENWDFGSLMLLGVWDFWAFWAGKVCWNDHSSSQVKECAHLQPSSHSTIQQIEEGRKCFGKVSSGQCPPLVCVDFSCGYPDGWLWSKVCEVTSLCFWVSNMQTCIGSHRAVSDKIETGKTDKKNLSVPVTRYMSIEEKQSISWGS